MSHPNLLDSSDAVLVVIDMQDSLLKAVCDRDRVVANTLKLIEAAKVFSLPILVTLQNAEKLGGCTQAVADALPHSFTINKMSFSCFGGQRFPGALEDTSRRQAILCGVESHVCVNQTAHDFLGRGYSTHVVRDAVSSRTPENRIAGIEKMRDSGCVITTTEMAIFELTEDASSDEFRQILRIVK